MANEDLLTQVQLRAVSLIEASTYFTPVSGKAIPAVSEVREDVVAAIKMRNPCGLICIVGIEDAPIEDAGGGCLRIAEGRLIVRIRETVALNRSASGTGENALRVAQQVLLCLHLQVCAMTTGATPERLPGAGIFQALRPEPALADNLPGTPPDGVLAYHSLFRFSGTITPFTRRGSVAAEGSP